MRIRVSRVGDKFSMVFRLGTDDKPKVLRRLFHVATHQKKLSSKSIIRVSVQPVRQNCRGKTILLSSIHHVQNTTTTGHPVQYQLASNPLVHFANRDRPATIPV